MQARAERPAHSCDRAQGEAAEIVPHALILHAVSAHALPVEERKPVHVELANLAAELGQEGARPLLAVRP